jgi:signal transduction histidine kinase/DNA-binding response OmpR family regulator/ligand-binding sensor domain-containing protein
MKAIIFLTLLFISCQTFGQEHYVFSPINSTNGLSENRVRSLCQLQDGRMVMITEGLINIYNGTSFSYMHYNEKQAYRIDNYSGLHHAYVDNENHLWLKNRYKLMLFDIRQELFTPNIDSVFVSQGIRKHVVDFFIDAKKNFWYITGDDELYYRNSKDSQAVLFLNHISMVSKAADELYDIALHEQFLFLLYKSGLMVCYNINTQKELYRENPFKGKENPYNETLMVASFGQYLYQVRNGNKNGILLRYNIINREWEKVLETNYWLNTLTIDNKGNCWISSATGLWVIDPTLRDKQLISPLQMVDGKAFESEISTQYTDNTGGLWVGTVNRGMLYYHRDRFKFRNFGPSLFKLSNTESISVHCLSETASDVWVGTEKGLYCYSKNKQNIEPIKLIPQDSHCEMLLKDRKQRIWVCTSNNGLFCIDSNQVKHFNQPVCCNYLYESTNGQLYLCTSNGAGIFDIRTGSYKELQFASGKSLGSTYQITRFRDDLLLGFDNEGLFVYNPQGDKLTRFENESEIQQHNNYNYHCLYSDSRGLIWLGTKDGLYVYNPEEKTIERFYEEDGLVNNSIRSIIEDNSGKIWVSTSNGITRIEIAANKGKYDYSLVSFNHFDGLISNEFLPRSAIKTGDNRLLWGGLDGFNEIDLTNIDTTSHRLAIPLFTKLLVSGSEIKPGKIYGGNMILAQSISVTKEIHLKYDQNFVAIEFSALNYINPTQTYYRYMLEGADNTWQEQKTTDGTGRINYTRLAPGTYHLKVYAANNREQWGSRYAEMTIIIEPPFWQTLWAYIIYVSIMLGLVYIILLYYVRRNKQQMQKQQKNELEQMKMAFYTNISHELRTPLTLILTPLGSILKKIEEEPLKQQLNGIHRNATELLKMVNQLLDFRKLETIGETLQLSYCNIGEFINTIVGSFEELKSEKEIEFTYECHEQDLNMYVDKEKMQRIIYNLLSNAYKFTPRGGQITLKVEKEPDEPLLKIQITDTGCGIPENDLPKIFDRFYQAKNQQGENSGSGIGLHIAKEYTVMHNGKIEVTCPPHKGSIFTVFIPIHLQPESLLHTEIDSHKGKMTQKILLIEDNAEFRTFLQNELTDRYTVLVASNGKEGLTIACEAHPDVVITDMMMPEMSGTEFCHSLKNNINISHIPVIMLTARNSDQAQIESFEAGADAYVTKPFNMDIVRLHIDRLTELQQQRKSSFKKTIAINPESFTNTNIDEDLIIKALKYIENNIDNASYTVEQLSKDMCMDRTGLYRKLTAITGLTPTEFIRSIRLKRAAQLLANGLSVTEVADRTGFRGTTSYFAKCFQEEFGVKPSQYKETLR